MIVVDCEVLLISFFLVLEKPAPNWRHREVQQTIDRSNERNDPLKVLNCTDKFILDGLDRLVCCQHELPNNGRICTSSRFHCATIANNSLSSLTLKLVLRKF